MIISITGTPGTGKTSVGNILSKKGFNVIDFNRLIEKQNFIKGFDKKRQTKIVDIKKINDYIKQHFKKEELTFIDGHLSHLIESVDYIILLRRHPKKLLENLQKKNWSIEKIKENIEAEILDIILCEAIDLHGKDSIFEIDTTDKKVHDVFLIILELVKQDFQNIKNYKIGSIDWSEEIFKDYERLY